MNKFMANKNVNQLQNNNGDCVHIVIGYLLVTSRSNVHCYRGGDHTWRVWERRGWSRPPTVACVVCCQLQHPYHTAFIAGRSTVKRDTLPDCLLMSAIRHVHFSRPINTVLVVTTQFAPWCWDAL